MEMIKIEVTPEEQEVIKKALRCYHYEINYRMRIAAPNPLKYPHPLDDYFKNEAEAAESILLHLKNNG